MVKKSSYIPDRGDIAWLDFNPQLGHEQRGRRPALVLSHKAYNEKTGLALFCPVTSKEKGYPFEVSFNGKKVRGAILSDQVKNLDWTRRNIEHIEKISAEALIETVKKIQLLIQ
jgi:mRNA interferase MazF